VNAMEVIKHIEVIPMSVEKPCTKPTNGELRRWFESKSVVLNGVTPKPFDEVEFPIESLIFFPKGKRKTTVI
jgi:hypothetical protein